MPKEPHVPLARLFAMAFNYFMGELHARLRERGYGDVRPAFGFVLLAAREHGTTAKEIAELMGMTKQAAAKLVEAMVSARYLARRASPTDARVVLLELTAKGEALLATVEDIYADLEGNWAETLGVRGLTSMRRDLTRALQATHGGELPAIRPTW